MVKMPADSSTITKCHMAWLGPSVEEIDPNIHRFPPGKWWTNTGSPTWNSLCLAQTCCSFWDCCLSCALIEIAGLRRCRCDDRIHPSRSSAGVTPSRVWHAMICSKETSNSGGNSLVFPMCVRTTVLSFLRTCWLLGGMKLSADMEYCFSTNVVNSALVNWYHCWIQK